MVKCESLRKNMFRITHTGKSLNFSVTTARIASKFIFLSAVHKYNFHIFTVIYLSLRCFIWNQHNNQLQVDLLAQLVERCTDIAEVTG